LNRDELTFDAIATYSLRGNNRVQVRYLLTRLTAYVETGCLKANEADRYLTEPNDWHIEHLWPNVHKEYSHEEPDAIEFRMLRSRLGALGLLPGRDNSALGAMPLTKKTEFYPPANILVGILDPTLNRGPYTRIRDFAKANRIQDVFRNFPEKSTIREVLGARTELYRRLCQHIWDPGHLELASRDDDGSHIGPTESSAARPSGPRNTLAGAISRGRTGYAMLVKAGVITSGTTLVGIHARKEYRATVGDDGLMYLDSGKSFADPSEAGRIIKNTTSCDGLAFWQVEYPDGSRVALREVRKAAQLDGRIPTPRRSTPQSGRKR
jgi:hypothetical protein